MSRFIDSVSRLSITGKIIAVNTAVFTAVNVLALFGVDTTQWLSLPSSLIELAHRPWTLFTYMFTHYSFFHLLFNMLWLYWFGGFFMTLGNSRQMVVLYLYGGLAGAALYIGASYLTPMPGGLLCGASASVLAIVVASAWLTPNLRIPLLIFGEVAIKWLAVGSVVLSVLALPGNNAGGNLAHLGGALMGAMYALAFKAGHDITGFGKRRAIRRKFKLVKPTEINDDKATLDMLLDKVRVSGYGALSKEEKKKLLELSSKL